jgi:hypothetical protein
MPGDYYRFSPIYGMSVIDIDLPVGSPILQVAKSPTRKITVQKIMFAPSVYAVSTLTFVDSISGVVICTLAVPSMPPNTGDGSNTIFADFGPKGTQLTAGASLLLGVTPPASAAGRLHIECYQAGPLPITRTGPNQWA